MLLLLLAAAATGACSDSTAPAPAVPGTYVLDAVVGPATSTLPVLISSTPASGQVYTLADTLVLRADGTFAETERDSSGTTAQYGTPVPPHVGSSTVGGTWTASGDQVTLQYGPSASLRNNPPGAAFTGTLTGAGRYTLTQTAQLGTLDYVWNRR